MQRLFIFFAFLLLAACQSVPPPGGFTPQQVAVLEENGFENVGDNWELGLADRLLFPSDESELGEAQAAIVARLTTSLLGIGVTGARVVGHTDSTGTDSHNEALSLARALAVKGAMVSAGMPEAGVREEGAGARRPVESNATAAGRQENRRVVIIVSSLGAA